MKNLPLLLGTLFGTILLIVGVVFFFSKQTTGALPSDTDVTQLVSESPHVTGATESAQVTIVEFSDFQCPACKGAEPIVQSVLAQYPEEVQLVYRHLPLSSIHPNALMAALASEVAAEENLFWEYHDLLFERQESWSEISSQSQLKEQFADYGQELGIDKASFLERIESDRIKALVTEDVAMSGQLNIQATPTFFVNGRPSPASQLSATVESIINSIE